jgi:pimeloyl-ACP methyl ester carboxylesterase
MKRMQRCTSWKLFTLCCLLASPLLAQPIHIEYMVRAGGINQWIKVDGDSESKPVLLFLHGGPGSSVMSYEKKFTQQLKKQFVVVQWDQRESGKTLKLNPSRVPLTVELFESDALEVIQHLTNRFQKKKIYLAGHSWGGFLALWLASRHAELFEACFAVSPMIHQVESEKTSLRKMEELALSQNNKLALEELDSIHIPFQNGEQIYFHRKWLYKLINKQKEPFSPEYVEQWADKWLHLFNEASEINLFEKAGEINCPVYFLLGSKDYQTNFELTKSYYEKLKAPKKELFWFYQSAHLPNLTESAKFQEAILSTLSTKP